MRFRALTAFTTLLTFVVAMVWPQAAGAQAQLPPPATAGPPPSVSSDDVTMQQAKQHFESGKNAYNAGDYAGSIREFKAAEQLRPSPILDYNIGLANEKLNKRRVAVKYYKRYLDLQPNAKNRDEVEQRINSLQSMIAQEPPPAATATPGGNAPQSAEQGSDMPPPEAGAGPSAPVPGYDPYASPAPPGYAMQPPKKKKSLWWLGIVIPGAVLVCIVLPIVLVVVLSSNTTTNVNTFDRLPPNTERIDRHDVGTTLLRF